MELPGAEKKMIGFVIILEAKNIAEVREMVENDIYYTSGVVRRSLVCIQFWRSRT